MDNLFNEYKLLFKELYILNTNAYGDGSSDNEASHELQDKIYRKFIGDILSNKFKKVEEIKAMGLLMKLNVVDYDVGRWYA